MSIYSELRKNSKIKQCLHPDKNNCNEIINAHSMQNGKILKEIAENGIVLMAKSKFSDPQAKITKWGRYEATTFWGFCQRHDSLTFQPIEINQFNSSTEHIFLYTYRNLCYHIHKRMEELKMFELANPTNIKVHSRHIDNGYELGFRDLSIDKSTMDNCLLTARYESLSSIVWEFDQSINFASFGYNVVTHDLSGRRIQNLANIKKKCSHIYMTVFCENEKTFCIFSWLKEDDRLFSKYTGELKYLHHLKRKVFLNNYIPLTTEMIAFRPSSWDSMSEEDKNWITQKTSGEEDAILLFGSEYFDMLEPTTYDLFRI